MCGIAGVLDLSGGPVDPRLVEAMNETQRHRGPDDAGLHVAGPVGLGNRRLAIIDRALGAQPMGSPDGSVWITYNGEVFNFEELRRHLEGRGHAFRTRCDTEVVLAAYLEYGVRCVDRFNGQFAFGIWDGRTGELFLARDRLGINPLHHATVDGQFVFASEAKAILRHPGVRREADRTAVAEMLLCGTTFDGRTMFEGIRSLEPGHTMTVGASGVRVRRYWDIPLSPDLGASRDDDAYERELLPLLEDALSMRLVGEVPWGMMLSGGTDSSTLATLASRMTEEPVQSFTIDFPNAWKGRDIDSMYAELVAGEIGAKHHAFVVDPDDYFDVLERLCWHLERPFNKGAASMYLLYERMREHVTVILSGEGADELFAGYVGSRGLGLDDVLASGRIDSLPWAPEWRAASALFSDDFRREVRPDEVFEHRVADSLAGAETDDLLNQALYLYCKHFLLELLEIHDRTSLAFGVEGRFPFLDHRFVERFFPMPSRLKYDAGRTKVLFKRAIRGLVPDEVIERRKTHMPIPRDPTTVASQMALTRELLLDPAARTAGWFNRDRVEGLLSRTGPFEGLDMVGVWQLTMYLITLELTNRVFEL
jgi:asparagine synthase (glutamine-hydrolysing)